MRSILTPLAVLVRPRSTFDRLSERPRWVWAFALLAILITLVANVAVGTPHMIAFQKEAMESANEGVVYTSDESEGGVRTAEDAKGSEDSEGGGSDAKTDEDVVIPENVQGTMETLTVVSAYVFGSLGVALGALALAGVIYGVTRLWSNETRFVVVLGVVALAKMPDAVRNLVQAVYTGATGVWVQHQGLGALVAPADIMKAPGVPYALLSVVDVYAIWFVVLLFLGMRHAMGLERRRAAIVTGGYLAITIVFAVVPALVAGVFMPA